MILAHIFLIPIIPPPIPATCFVILQQEQAAISPKFANNYTQYFSDKKTHRDIVRALVEHITGLAGEPNHLNIIFRALNQRKGIEAAGARHGHPSARSAACHGGERVDDASRVREGGHGGGIACNL